MIRISRATATLTTSLLGVLVLLSTLPVWVRATTPTATGDLPVAVSGTTASPATASIGLVIIAAGLVLGLAGRGIRIAALVAVIGANLLAGWTIIALLSSPDVVAASAAAEITSVRAINPPVSVTPWPYLSLVVLAAGVAIGIWLLTHLGTWQDVGRRYETGQPRSEGHDEESAADASVRMRRRAMDDWDALSRGEDPT